MVVVTLTLVLKRYQSTVPSVLSKNVGTVKLCLFKAGACFIQVHFNVDAFLGNEYMLAQQVASSIEVATKTGFTVLHYKSKYMHMFEVKQIALKQQELSEDNGVHLMGACL